MNSTRHFAVLVGGVLLALSLIPINAPGQVVGGSIVGVVADPSGAVVPGAQVQATNVDTADQKTTITNSEGYYEFPLLPAGRYVLSVEQSGFQKGTTAEITLHAGTRPKIDMTLKVGATSQTVQVLAAAPLVNAQTTDIGTVIDTKQVEGLPLTKRSFLNLLDLEPGVVNFTSEPVPAGDLVGKRGGVSFNGSSAFGNNYLLDGVDMAFGENNGVGDAAGGSGGNGTYINTVSVEGVEEVKTTGSAVSAQYGRSTGATIEVTTKSGTNKFHGEAFEYFGNDKLNAGNFFQNSAGLPKPELRLNQYGGNIGGPIKKDKAFFFFNYEGANIIRGTLENGIVLTPAAIATVANPALRTWLTSVTPTQNCSVIAGGDSRTCFHQRNDSINNNEKTTLSRVDFNVSSKQTLAVRFNYNNQEFDQPWLDPTHRRQFPQFFKNLGFEHNYTLSPTKFNEFRFGINDTWLNRHDTVNGEVGGAFIVGLTTLNVQCRINFHTKTYTVTDNFTAIKGRHTLKTGLDIRKLNSRRIIIEQPYLDYNSVTDLINDHPLDVELDFGLPNKGFDQWQSGFYFQDDFRATRRLQINMGLRYELYSGLHGPINIATNDPFGPLTTGPIGPNNIPIFNVDYHDFGPHLGFVYDLTGSGKTILRAGGAMLYVPPQGFYYYDMSFLPGGINLASTFRPIDLPASVLPLTYPFPNSFQTTVLADAAAGDLGTALPGFNPSRSVTERNHRDEQSEQWNFSIQHAVSQTLVVQAAYVGSAGEHLLADDEVNLVNPATGLRPNPNFAPIAYRHNDGRSNYHALQLTANQRFNHGLTFDAFYTYSHELTYDDADGSYGNLSSNVQDFSNVRGSYGTKADDTTHRFVMVPSYQVPTAAFAKGSRLTRALLGGWTLEGTLTWRSGYPLDVVDGFDAIGNGRPAGQRPDPVPGVNPRVYATRLQWFTPGAFSTAAPVAQKRFGSLGWNTLRGPSAFWSDMGLRKMIPIYEQNRLELRFESFNWLNHVDLGQPDVTLSDSTFGRITSGSNGRNFQIAVKYLF